MKKRLAVVKTSGIVGLVFWAFMAAGARAEDAPSADAAKKKTREAISIEKDKPPTWRERWAKRRQEKRDYRVHFTEGFLAQEDGDYKKAIRSYERAIKYNPSCASAFLYRGYCQYRLGEVGDAILSYQTAIQMQPELKMAYYHLGVALHSQRRMEDARAQIEKLKGMDEALATDLAQVLEGGSERPGNGGKQ
ncbi:MAG: tetratricopeptide repeat protein [Planctomycetes bacterium]|nr:tetratricopeptide repeat protein [Planctomycetota bacterium]